VTVHILTLFPKSFDGVFTESIIKRAQEKKLVNINLINIREFAKNKAKTVDDKPYGGGRGMVLKVDVVIDALESIKPKPYAILLSASGRKYTQQMAKRLSGKKSLAIICGHYEGVDTRVEKYMDDVISIGDFVMTGGEIAAMAIADSVARLIPGVIQKESTESESFSQNGKILLEHPHYTRPENFRSQKVPQVLLSGNHKQIEQFRGKEALKRTKKFRPDLIRN